MSETRELLAEYARSGSESAFEEVVGRYLNLVYSTALRMVNGDAPTAEDVAQRVFTDLAKMAGSMPMDVMLGGWLHRHTCFLARKALRGERRRKAREQQAAEMNDFEDHAAMNLVAMAPILDEAINQLGSEDRQAIVLRYFEQRDFRSVGTALGSNEEAARKRVNRAVDKLRTLLQRRGVTLSTATLGTALGTGIITAAPAGLVGVISSAALSTAAVGGGTALTLLHIMAMTKIQGGIIAGIAVALAIPLVMQYRAQQELREENASLRATVQRVEALVADNERLSNLVARSSQPTPTLPASKEQFNELMKLRGEVGVLRKNANEVESITKAGTASPLSGITANPEMTKMIRDQQKMGMSFAYKGLSKRANIPPEKMEALNELLADDVMTNINHITAVLRDGKSVVEMDHIFTQQEAELQEKVKALLGSEAFGEFQDYTRNLASYISAEQFKGLMLKGDKETKENQAHQLYQVLQEESNKALAAAGLRPDHQLVPSMNFRNIASEEESERNLQLLDSIYEQAQARAGTFLSPEEVEKFGEFRKTAINNNRMALAVNRKLMAPALTTGTGK